MNLFEGHDRFVQKNATLAKGYDVKKRDEYLEKKGVSHLKQGKDATCFDCKFKAKCKVFEKLRTGGSSGAVSFGGDNTANKDFLCEKFEPMKKNNISLNDKQIKSLMKNAMKGMR